MTRLPFLFLILLAFGEARAARPRVPTGTIEMVIEREGAKIGSHIISVRRSRGDTIVNIDIEVRVRVLFVTVYAYRKNVRETWRNGRLFAYDARIDDNGDKLKITARTTPAGLVVQGPKGKLVAPPGSMFTGYWNMDTVRQTRLIDGEENKFLNIAVTDGGERRITVGGRAYRARLFHLRGDMERDVWYDRSGRLVKIRAIVRDGSEVVTSRR